MLSGESAMGRYPEESVAMLAKIAASPKRAVRPPCYIISNGNRPHQPTTAAEATASVVEHALTTVPCAAVFVATKSGATAR